MNYRHIYHAGNACDVFKHAVVAMIVERLRAKPAAFRVLDAHAGLGLYDLSSEEALKTGEAQDGIVPVFDAPAAHPALSPYLEAVRALNPGGALRLYPGSPRLVRALLRPQDRLVLNELHPEDHAALKKSFAGDAQVAVHKADAYDALKAHLPPPERRGMVLIDPPFEEPDEFRRMMDGLATAYKRWPTGVFVLWYPIKDRAAVWRFHEAIEQAGIARVLLAELMVHPEDTHLRLNGSGLAIVNPPWQLDEALRDVLPALHALLPTTGGGTRVEWLVPEASAAQ